LAWFGLLVWFGLAVDFRESRTRSGFSIWQIAQGTVYRTFYLAVGAYESFGFKILIFRGRLDLQKIVGLLIYFSLKCSEVVGFSFIKVSIRLQYLLGQSNA